MLVVGLEGGADGGPPAAPGTLLALETVRDRGGSAEPGGPALVGEKLPSDGAGVFEVVRGGGAEPDAPGGGGVPAPAGRGVARGGGGVAILGALSSPPAALLTQRFRSGSYTKLDFSPNLARIGLLGELSADSFFEEPPLNQEPRPQPFLAFDAFSASARFAGWQSA